MEGMVATIPAHAYMIGINVFGLFFLSHIKDPNAASDKLNIWMIKTHILSSNQLNNQWSGQ